jgi:hypothetical protein
MAQGLGFRGRFADGGEVLAINRAGQAMVRAKMRAGKGRAVDDSGRDESRLPVRQAGPYSRAPEGRGFGRFATGGLISGTVGGVSRDGSG